MDAFAKQICQRWESGYFNPKSQAEFLLVIIVGSISSLSKHSLDRANNQFFFTVL